MALGGGGSGSAGGAACAFLTGVLHSWRMPELVGGEAEQRLAALVADAVAADTVAPSTVIVRWDGSTLRVELSGPTVRDGFALPTA
jgi:hypothetical protein